MSTRNRKTKRLGFEYLEQRVALSGEVLSISTFRDQGAQVSWSPAGDSIAYAAQNVFGYYQIHLANPSGANDVVLTGNNNTTFQYRNTGSPAWDPSGRYIAFVAEKASHPGFPSEAIPGFGGYSDVWVMTADGKRAFQLTDEPNDADHGVLIPRFSPDGKHLSWTERVEQPNPLDPNKFFGYWVLKTADFVVGPDGSITLANVQSFAPGGPGFYEGYGYSPDGKSIIFCSDMNQRPWWDSQIFTMDAATGSNLQQLTQEFNYNEHAAYTPDGKSIVWMTTQGVGDGGTDWWIMDADGEEKRQLTFFNVPGNPEYAGQVVWAGLVSFSPDGKRFVGDVQTNLFTQVATIKMVNLQLIPIGTGTGLTGEYFNNRDLTGLTLRRTDPTVDFNWGLGSPDPSIANTTFSVRWTGQVQARYSETYTFYTQSDDGVRLWVNGQLLINNWTDHPATENSGTISLIAGQKYDIRMEYYHDNWLATASLSWSSPSQPKSIIPKCQLYPAATAGVAALWVESPRVADPSAGMLISQVTVMGSGMDQATNTLEGGGQGLAPRPVRLGRAPIARGDHQGSETGTRLVPRLGWPALRTNGVLQPQLARRPLNPLVFAERSAPLDAHPHGPEFLRAQGRIHAKAKR